MALTVVNQQQSRAGPPRNPYAPPQVDIVDVRGPRPRQVRWAVTALWLAWGLTFLHALVVVLDGRLLTWPPEQIVWTEVVRELLSATLIALLAGGRFAALLVYAALLCVRTVNVVQLLRPSWEFSPWLVGVTALSFTLQYLALFWSFTLPGRRWFRAVRV